MKSAIHQKLVMREQEKYSLQTKSNDEKKRHEEMQENLVIYSSILEERRRTLVNSYLMKDQEDLERILKTLYDHF